MALVISSETNVSIPRNTAVEIIPTRLGRKLMSFQFLSPGQAWVKFGGTAAPNDGFFLSGTSGFNPIGGIPGDTKADFYEGPVSVFYEGFPGHDDLPNSEVATVRVIEMS